MDIKKIIIFSAIAISNIGLLFSAETLKEIEITKETPMQGTGFIRYRATFPDGTRISCDRKLPEKPSCSFMKPGKSWEKTQTWQHWYLLEELLKLQEKLGKEEATKFEKEFAEIKNSAKSEAEFMEYLKNKLISDL